jgi:hypothetical protein
VADESQRDSLWTPGRSPPTPLTGSEDYFGKSKSAAMPARHRRAHSYSTIDEHQVAARDSDVGAFRIVIERPGTSKEEPFDGIPTLKVSIPSYKLGTPRFSTRGTAFLRNSSHTTENGRSSIFSQEGASARDTGSHRPGPILSRRHSDASPHLRNPVISPSSPYSYSSLPSPGVVRLRTPIVPEMFDNLTFKPACDHPSVVRYSIGGGIRAATPARLVAEITSTTFVDYDLLSDFFLTFRSFLDTTDLLYMLVARLKWALARHDENGTVVRVRTFVAMRHWILNYFLDDFVVNYELRKTFCDLLNAFVFELSPEYCTLESKIPLKILGELKKCWRRVCALYWDGPEFDTELGPEVPISPGGVAGSRNPKLDPTFWQTHPAGPPRLDGIIEPDFIRREPPTQDERHYFADVSRAGHMHSVLPVAQPVPTFLMDAEESQPPLSPTSILSEDFVSCSFPHRVRGAGYAPQLGAHPVPASSIYDQGPVATTPKALTGKRVRPHAHKRSASFSDSFRDQRIQIQQPVQKVLYKSTELLLALPYAGSLVRGNLFPPAQAFVEIMAPSTPAEASRATTLFPGRPRNQKEPSAMSGPGMKKLLGSVRRALSTRTGPNFSSSPTQGSFPNMPPLGVRGATINRLPGTAVVPQAQPCDTGARAPMRIDLLGAEVAEDFKRAVEEDAEADAEELRGEREHGEGTSTRSSIHDPGLRYSVMRPDTTLLPSRTIDGKSQNSGMTTGSGSIVIVDATPLSLDPVVMTGALPTANASSEMFEDTFMHPSEGLTPPSTPPEIQAGIPRRSSHLLGEIARRKSLSFDSTPSLMVDSRPSGEEERSPTVHRPMIRTSMMRPRGHSYSKKSISLRRYASYQSGFTRHKSERSFDATTFSESEDVERLSQAGSIPLPLRVLRRRPGGDLRAVSNVGDLHAHPLRRTMSTGSIATFSDSARDSYLLSRDSSDYVNVVSSDYDQSRLEGQTFSLGALAEAAPKPRVSLLSTHSSQPVMRQSFEKQAAILAQIPDDVYDDGGVESALLKLEGKFEQRNSGPPGENPSQEFSEAPNSFGATNADMSSFVFTDDEEGKKRHRQKHIMENNPSQTSPLVRINQPQNRPVLEELKPAVYQPRGMELEPIASSPRSMESYNSTPLLERDLADDGRTTRRRSRNWSHHSVLRVPNTERRKDHDRISDSNSFDFMNETASMVDISAQQVLPGHESMVHSFLDPESDSEDRSDLSSELSLEVISRTEYNQHDSYSTQTFPPISSGTVIKEMALPSDPPHEPPSPTLTLIQALMLSPKSAKFPQNRDKHILSQTQLPPTPQISPTARNATLRLTVGRGATPSIDPLRSNRIVEASRKTSVHLPFTLAFDSQVLAQQFTLIEKDALNEIDWKDLIEMRWKDSNTDSRSWVEFLRAYEPRGVEVVIARFNLMVKWAVSECVLTQDLGERVRCIIKYIHIAAHCRRYRNFATMTQLTVALTSKDIARLTNTWSYVPAVDMQTLKDLEDLITPTSNFQSLRAEMEGSGTEQGCIPFVGIYTHDLLVNSERPSQFASTPTTEPLVNFERCRTDATIIKNLLRLLEASQLYRFLPIEGITERCLWMAALTDEEIYRYGKMIQA